MKCSVCGAEMINGSCASCSGTSQVEQSQSSNTHRNGNIHIVISAVIATVFAAYSFFNSDKGNLPIYQQVVVGIAIWAVAFAISFAILRHSSDKKTKIARMQKKSEHRAQVTTEKAAARQKREAQKAELDASNIVYCPRCLCTSISADKKGFGIGKAVVGSSVIKHPIGLVAGNIGAKKVRCTCLKCGYSWIAGTR